MSFATKKISAVKAACLTWAMFLPMLLSAQNMREIKNFNESFTFSQTHTIDLETEIHSETISGFSAVATFSIDQKGKGSIDFKIPGGKSTLVIVDYSQIKTFNQMIYWNFGCTHSERPEKIQMTIEIDPESNTVKKFVIYNEHKKKAFVFY